MTNLGNRTDWSQRANRIQWRIRPFIGGTYHRSTALECCKKINPATEQKLFEMSVGSAEDVRAAVCDARARFADGSWSKTPAERGALLRKLADLIAKYSEEIALLDTLEMGKPIRASLHDAEVFAPAVLRSCAHFAEELWARSAPLTRSALAFNSYEPRGVIGAITPWNFPIVNAAIKVGPALATGNTVVLKPSEVACGSALRLAELAIEAGIPAGVLNVVPGLGSTVGVALSSDPDVSLLSFTGSTLTGRKVMELAARSNGKPVLLECGGKSPQVVFDDVNDLERVADATVQSFLRNQGQVCSAHTRLVVHESIKDLLLAKVVERAARYRPGDPLQETTDFGPLASPAQRDRVRGYIEQGIREGANPVLRGQIQDRDGCFVSPTIFDQVTLDMAISQEEIFGPVLCTQSFRTEDEAMALANGTEYGLAATVWTRDIGRARRMAHAIRAGHVSIRTSGEEGYVPGYELSSEPQKASGFGAELGLQGLQAYSTLKAISFGGG